MTKHLFNASEWLVDRHVEGGRGGSPVFHCGDATLTYEELQTAVWAAANGLRSIQVEAGDRILMIVDDEIAFPSTFLAGLRMGAIPVPVSTMLKPDELAFLANDAGAKVLVISNRYAGHLADIAAKSPSLQSVVLTGPATTDDLPILPKNLDLFQLSTFDDTDEADVAPTHSAATGFWLYTSGTTGEPKAAIHRHGDLRAISETYARSVLAIDSNDVCYSVPKLFFAFGLGNALVFPLSVGARAVLDPDPPNPAKAAALLTRHRPSLFFAPPGFCAAMVDAALPEDALASVRVTVTAGEALPPEVQRRFIARFGTEMLDGIGSTEALHVFCSNHPGDVRPGTSGRPVAGYELKLLDEAGNVVTEPDVSGALWVRGESVADGYWQRPAITSQTFVDGWLRTGDLYSRSSDGYYRFIGRNSDMMKAGGIWVSPVEVENVLLEHEDVLEAAVVGARDALGLETIVAFVVPRSGRTIDATNIDRHYRERMAAFKRPREVRVLPALPRTPTGKVKRFVLRSIVGAE